MKWKINWRIEGVMASILMAVIILTACGGGGGKSAAIRGNGGSSSSNSTAGSNLNSDSSSSSITSSSASSSEKADDVQAEYEKTRYYALARKLSNAYYEEYILKESGQHCIYIDFNAQKKTYFKSEYIVDDSQTIETVLITDRNEGAAYELTEKDGKEYAVKTTWKTNASTSETPTVSYKLTSVIIGTAVMDSTTYDSETVIFEASNGKKAVYRYYFKDDNLKYIIRELPDGTTTEEQVIAYRAPTAEELKLLEIPENYTVIDKSDFYNSDAG